MSVRRRFAALAALALVSGLVWVSPTSLVGPATVRAVTPTHTVPGDFPTIQEAIDAAAPGDIVLVGDGAWHEHLTITKSLTLTSVNGPATTILDGDFGLQSLVSVTMEAAEAVTISGFTLRNSGQNGFQYGAGMVLNGAGDATISDNLFVDNVAAVGAGIYSTLSGTVTISGNRFFHLTGVAVSGIALENVGATTIVNNVFGETNRAAISWSQASSPTGASIRNNTFADGATNQIAGLAFSGAVTTILVRNNLISGNSDQPLVNCGGTPVFEGNDTWQLGTGGAYLGCGTDPVGTNGNVAVDPKLIRTGFGGTDSDYHLRTDSPLIDAGVADATVTTDIDGETRPYDGDGSGGAQIDIGADENTTELLLDPNAVTFGTFGVVELGAHSDKTITVTNHGGSSASITSAAATGSGADQISEVQDDCEGQSIAAGGSCQVILRYAPTTIADLGASFVVSGPGAVGTARVPLFGYGQDVLQFFATGWADVPVGTTHTGYLRLENDSATQSLTVTSVAITGGAGAADFEITNNPCTAPIAPNTHCDVSIAFTPSVLGQRDVEVTATGPFPVGTRPRSWYATGLPPTTPVTLGSTLKPGPAYTWNAGNALGRTLRSTTQYLHQGYATHRISGSWAKDTGGPYAGIYYVRSTSGSTWTTPKRISPSTKHAIRFGLASAGSRVYVTYVTQTRIYNFSPTAPRVLYVRVNTNHGDSSYWKSAIPLSSSTGRVDYPTIAAYGYDVHVAWTDSNTGYVYVATSRDRGATWTKRKVGSTTWSADSGKIGYPSVAASGSTVAVSWVADATGAVKTRISTDRGSTWRTATVLAGTSTGELSTAVRSGRVGVTWADGLGIHVRTWTSGGGWGDDLLAETAYSYPMYAPVIALQGTTRIALSWAEETATSGYVMLRYAESTSNGATWYAPLTWAGTSSSTHRGNDWPSIVWPSAGTRYVSWNGWTDGTLNYRLYLRKGTGTPVGLASVAPVMTPDGGVGPAAGPTLRPSKTEFLPPH